MKRDVSAMLIHKKTLQEAKVPFNIKYDALR
jgi:hypothetical protein